MAKAAKAAEAKAPKAAEPMRMAMLRGMLVLALLFAAHQCFVTL